MNAVRCLTIWVSISLSLFLAHSRACAQEAVVSREYAIKAGVMSVLSKFVTWPAEAAPDRSKPLIIGVLGQDPFVENGVNQLDQIVAEETRKGGHVTVERYASAKDYHPCHILFVSSQAAEGSAEKTLAERLAAATKLTAGTPVLVVGEATGLAQQGAAVNLMFDRDGNRVRLEINPDAANRASLRLAPQLLRLSVVQIVRDPQR